MLFRSATLGATWLIMKTEGETMARAQRLAKPLGLALLALIGAVAPVAIWLVFDLGVSQVVSWGYLLVPPVVMTLGAVLRLTARIRVRGS